MINFMMQKQLLLPLLLQVLLTFFLLFRMAYLRITTLTRGETKIKDIALGQNAWPNHVTQVANSFHNQLELPILFYIATLLAIQLKSDSLLIISLSWCFVISRMLHALIHNTTNHVIWRFRFFAISAIVLLIEWIALGLLIV